ncbi:putative Chemotaxis protein histidine kinase-like protein [Syntrophobacter sp. SbD1]|nr:putative Chemotaxis protein histidine kinase-like protein [Syntrophobacter sp. SbD1]
MVSEIVVNEFIVEAREHLSNTENDLIAMEKGSDGEGSEIIDRLFRTIHSIKGASGTFGFPAVMELSHAMESVLLLFRDGRANADHGKINDLLSGVDKLKCMIDDIHSSSQVDCRNELERLKAIMQGVGKSPGRPSVNDGKSGSPHPAASTSVALQSGVSVQLEIKDPGGSLVTFQADADQIASALAMQHFVYAIRAHRDRDFEQKQRSDQDFLARLQKLGQCLSTDIGAGGKSDQTCHYLFATVLEPDLIGSALDISNEQVEIVTPEVLRQAPKTEPQAPRPQLASESQSSEALSVPVEKEKIAAPETVRVNIGLLDTLINLAGELVLGRNQLRQILEATVDTNPRLRTVIQNVNLVTSEMQAHILQMRMQPVKNILNRMHRLVRDLADQLSKEVEIFIEGGEVELDKSIIEGLVDPLVHIIRNCVDHGIETSGERIAAGKPAKGTIRVRASHEGGQVNITISDDGRGMNTGAVVEKAVSQGILSPDEARKMDESDKIRLIFLPGFSTAKTVTNISGRGVGMDVVKTNVERFGGHIDIDSVPGAGTTIRIRIPLTLAIISSLIVGAANQRFAIPQVNVKELVCIRVEDRRRRIEKVGDAAVLRLREKLLPLVHLADAVGLKRTFTNAVTEEEFPDRRIRIADRRENGEDRKDETARTDDRRRSHQGDVYVVVLRVVGNMFGLIVDELFDIEEIVVKPLSDHVRDCRCFAGSTIMGDGRVVMILDAPGIASSAKLLFAEVKSEQLRRQANETFRKKSAAARQSTLIFKSAQEEHFALPLSSISRLEKIAPEAVERIGNHEFITYCGNVLPLIRLDTFLPVRPLPASCGELYVIIPKSPGLEVGILISQVVDTVELTVDMDKSADAPLGFRGSAVVDNQITMFLDMEELLRMFSKGISIN